MIRKKTIYTKIRYYSILCLFFLFTVLLFIFSGCQEESEEITPPPSDKVIMPNSVVADLIQRVTLKDGSSDNILDKASCITLILPVLAVVNGQEIKIDSPDVFKTVEGILDEFENDNDTLHIIFPVTAILADHSELIINNAEEFEDIIDQCTEGGHDEDIECVDFQYPLTFSVYDSDNQLSNVVMINDDQELYKFVDTLEEGDLVSFKFPVMVILSGGEEITINNNDQLEDIIENVIDGCDEDDDNDHNDDDADVAELNAVLLAGDWEITHFFDGTDESGAFAGFVFTFNEDSTALSTDGVSSINGTWETNGDDGSIDLELDFGEETPFDKIKEDWELIEFSNSLIKLRSVNEVDESVTTLVFERI